MAMQSDRHFVVVLCVKLCFDVVFLLGLSSDRLKDMLLPKVFNMIKSGLLVTTEGDYMRTMSLVRTVYVQPTPDPSATLCDFCVLQLCLN